MYCLSPALAQILGSGLVARGEEVSEGLCLLGGVEHLGLEQVPPPWLVRCDKK